MSGKDKYKLSKQDIEAIQADTTSTHSALGRKYGVDHTTIIHHRRKVGQKPKSPHYKEKSYKSSDQKPEIVKIECDHCGKMFGRMDYKINQGNNFCLTRCAQAYGRQQRAENTETEEQKLLKKQAQCEHKLFMVKCSLCEKVIGSESNLIIERK